MIDVTKLLIELINIRSETNISNETIIKYIANMFKEYPVRLIPQGKEKNMKYNIVVRIDSEIRSDKKPVVFVMHTDTVIGEWFEKAEKKEEVIVGLGSCDMKGGIACVCAAVLEKKFDRDIILIFTSDEESEGLGAKIVLKEVELYDAIIIFPEPTTHKANDSQNSCLSFYVKTCGVMQHASGIKDTSLVSAISKMLRICEHINNTCDETVYSQNIGFINGGVSSNVIAPECTMKFERRFHYDVDIKRKELEIISDLRSLGAEDVEVRFLGSAFFNKDVVLKRKFKRVVDGWFNLEFEAFSAWSEAGIFKDKGNCFVFGPGDLAQAHKKDEFIMISELNMFKEIYIKLIEEL